MAIVAPAQPDPAAQAGRSSPTKLNPCRFIIRLAAPVADSRSAREPGRCPQPGCYNPKDVHFVPH